MNITPKFFINEDVWVLGYSGRAVETKIAGIEIIINGEIEYAPGTGLDRNGYRSMKATGNLIAMKPEIKYRVKCYKGGGLDKLFSEDHIFHTPDELKAHVFRFAARV